MNEIMHYNTALIGEIKGEDFGKDIRDIMLEEGLIIDYPSTILNYKDRDSRDGNKRKSISKMNREYIDILKKEGYKLTGEEIENLQYINELIKDFMTPKGVFRKATVYNWTCDRLWLMKKYLQIPQSELARKRKASYLSLLFGYIFQSTNSLSDKKLNNLIKIYDKDLVRSVYEKEKKEYSEGREGSFKRTLLNTEDGLPQNLENLNFLEDLTEEDCQEINKKLHEKNASNNLNGNLLNCKFIWEEIKKDRQENK